MDMCALCFPQPQRGKTARQYICRPIFAFSLSALLVFLNGFPSSELISSVFICLVFALLVSTYIILLFASLLNISYFLQVYTHNNFQSRYSNHLYISGIGESVKLIPDEFRFTDLGALLLHRRELIPDVLDGCGFVKGCHGSEMRLAKVHSLSYFIPSGLFLIVCRCFCLDVSISGRIWQFNNLIISLTCQ